MGPLRIGIAGLGHVGAGLIELVKRQEPVPYTPLTLPTNREV